MSFITALPADPECADCGGTGTICQSSHTGASHAYPCASIGVCGCRAFANREKIQQRCDHVFVCAKCGAQEPNP